MCPQALLPAPSRLPNYKTDSLSWSNQGENAATIIIFLFLHTGVLGAEVMVGSEQS